MFISIYGFSQTFWLNLIILWTFSKTNSWFNAYFKFLMCIRYSALPCKLATSLSIFSIFIFSGKNGKSLWNSFNFCSVQFNFKFNILKTNFKKISFITFLVIVLNEIFIKLRNIFDPLKVIYWKLLQHCQSYRLFTSQY